METPTNSSTDARNRTKAFCACGLSLTFPFCDGSQKIAKSHDPGKLMSCGPANQLDPSHAGTLELTA